MIYTTKYEFILIFVLIFVTTCSCLELYLQTRRFISVIPIEKDQDPTYLAALERAPQQEHVDGQRYKAALKLKKIQAPTYEYTTNEQSN